MFRSSYSKLARLSKEGHFTHKPCWLACIVLFGIFILFGHCELDCVGMNKKIERRLYFCSRTNIQISDYLQYISEPVKHKSCWIC